MKGAEGWALNTAGLPRAAAPGCRTITQKKEQRTTVRKALWKEDGNPGETQPLKGVRLKEPGLQPGATQALRPSEPLLPEGSS